MMGKNKDKNKDEIPNPSNITNRDILQRLNFLYQASVLLSTIAPPSSIHPTDELPGSTAPKDNSTGVDHADPPSHPGISRRKKRRRVVSVGELSRNYVGTMKSVGQRTNVRIDPSVKRRICKRCCAPLVPGVSAAVRIKGSPSHGHVISYQCHYCQEERRIPAPPVLRVDPPTNETTMEARPSKISTSTVPTAITGTSSSIDPERSKRKKRGPQPRLPPHFARDIGHIVFCGSERLDQTYSFS